ncbi:facilitated trehalose transporter Tret1-2 homolog isoform X2 [Anabrus simplex]
MQVEEAEPWLESTPTPVIQKTTWGSKPNHVDVYQATTVTVPEKRDVIHQVFASVIAASFHIVVGVAMAYSAILIPQLEAPESDIKVTLTESSWLASVLVLIVPVGALMAGVIMEYVGRLNTIVIAGIPCLLGWILIATSSSFTMLLFGRLLTGISSGFGTSPAIVYITEVAQPELRGSLISFCPTLASLGMVLIYAQGAYVSWRMAAWLNLIYILLPVTLVFLCIPESPVWLVARGEVEKAEKSLLWLAGKRTSAARQQLAAMVKSQDMKAIVASTAKSRLSAFLRPAGYKPLCILCGLFLIQQFSGIYITLFYAVTYFEDAGSSVDPSIATILVGAVRCFMSLCNTALMKRFGRRPLCMLSGCGMAICMIVSGFFTLHYSKGGTTGSWVPVACMLLYVCTSMIGLLSIPWTMTAELFPTEIRGIAHGIVISVAHVIMFGAVHSYRSLTSFLGGAHGVQWFFAAVSLVGSLFVWLFLPETHGVALKDFENYFNNNTLYIGQKKKEALSKVVVEDTSKELTKS